MTEIPERLLRRAQERRKELEAAGETVEGSSALAALIDQAEHQRMLQATGQVPTSVPRRRVSSKPAAACPHGVLNDQCIICLAARVKEIEARLDEHEITKIKEKYT